MAREGWKGGKKKREEKLDTSSFPKSKERRSIPPKICVTPPPPTRKPSMPLPGGKRGREIAESLLSLPAARPDSSEGRKRGKGKVLDPYS